MSQYTPAERSDIVDLYIENQNSIISTQRKFRAKFPERTAPTASTIRALYAKFKSGVGLGNVRRGTIQRRARSSTNITIAQDLLAESPNVSTSRHAQTLGISRSSMRRILRLDLGLSPQKIQMEQQLKPADDPGRLQYGKTMQK